MLLEVGASLWIFCLYDLSIEVNRVLKPTAIIVLLSVSPFMSLNIHFIYLGAPMFGVYIFLVIIYSWNGHNHSVLSLILNYSLCFKVYFF